MNAVGLLQGTTQRSVRRISSDLRPSFYTQENRVTARTVVFISITLCPLLIYVGAFYALQFVYAKFVDELFSQKTKKIIILLIMSFPKIDRRKRNIHSNFSCSEGGLIIAFFSV